MPTSPSPMPTAINQDISNSNTQTKASAIPATDNRSSENLNTFNNSNSVPPSVGTVLFHYHVGSLYGLATAARRLCATVGDDKQLMLWDVVDCELLAKTTLKASNLGHFVGVVRIFSIAEQLIIVCFRIRRGAAISTRASPSSR